MGDKNLVLVSAIESFPCLYNHNLQDYMKKDVTEKAWNEVANQVQLPVAECKEKWRNLRYSLLRSLKPNADGTLKKKYYLHKEMEFLIPFMRSKVSGLATHFDDEIDEELTQELHDVTSPQQQLFEFLPEPASKRKRQIEQYQSNFQIIDTDNSRRMFLLGILPEVNTLTDDQMKVFRRKVLALLDDITSESLTINFMEESSPDHNSYEKRVKAEPGTGDGTVYTIN